VGSTPLLFFVIVMAGLMFMMQRSNKKRQQQSQDMRNRMEPGAGVRTIGGMYALVKSVTEETVELEVAPGVHAIYSKQAIAQVMDPVEYNRIVHGDQSEEEEQAADETAEAGQDATVEDAPVALEKTEAETDKTPANVGGDKEASAK
jgi:preprotein translocase subunit YajC